MSTLTFASIVIGAAALASLTACGNLPKADKPTDPPSRTFTSTKPVAAVADCIERGWPTSAKVLTGEPLRVNRLPAPAGARKLQLMLGSEPDHQALVEPAGRGSRTSTWTFVTFFGDTPGQITVVQNCQ